MKKVYNTVALNVQSIALEANIMGASGIIQGGTAQAGTEPGGGVVGGNGGDANARGTNGASSSLGFDADLI